LGSLRSLNVRFDIPISRTREFWEALAQGRLVTTRCVECGSVTFPPQADCPKCMSGKSEWVEMDREAALVTCTRVDMAPTSFSAAGRYTVAIGETKTGLRVLAWLEGATPLDAKPGSKLRLEVRKGERGRPYYVFVLG